MQYIHFSKSVSHKKYILHTPVKEYPTNSTISASAEL